MSARWRIWPPSRDRFPHPTCLYPPAVERSAKALAGVDPASVRKIMQDNAAKLHRIELPSEARNS
jgi:hypothetical protein